MTAKTDRELLELAAKAAGITLTPVEVKNVEFHGDDRWIGYMTHSSQWARGWFDPLTDDGDALRLAVKLRINIEHMETMNRKPHGVNCWPVGRGDCGSSEVDLSDYAAATRRAIVRAAAAMGETL